MPIDNIVWDEPKDIVWDTPKQSALDRLKTKSTYGDFARTLNDSLRAASGATSGQSQLGRGLQD
ncbi:MAG: hypothetical protein KGI50_08240, partial [Patescibacteria group bacterium]|nr:hypothetical protein [Patescibacteria group bacterium]